MSFMVGTVPEIQWFRTTRNRVPGFDHAMFSFAENYSLYLVRTVISGFPLGCGSPALLILAWKAFYFLLPHYFEDPSTLYC